MMESQQEEYTAQPAKTPYVGIIGIKNKLSAIKKDERGN